MFSKQCLLMVKHYLRIALVFAKISSLNFIKAGIKAEKNWIKRPSVNCCKGQKKKDYIVNEGVVVHTWNTSTWLPRMKKHCFSSQRALSIIERPLSQALSKILQCQLRIFPLDS